MAAPSQVCVSCGAANPTQRERCEGCGAKLEPLVTPSGGSAAGSGSFHQEPFSVRWAGIAFGFYVVTLGIALVLLPFVIRTYDPQGLPGLLIADALWFVGGLLVGLRSPGRSYLEPVAAAALTAAIFVPYVAHISDVRALDTFGYVTAALIGLMGAGLGSYLGEHAQGVRATA